MIDDSTKNSARWMMEKIAHNHGVTYLDLISERRGRKLLSVRYQAIKEIRDKFTLSTPQLGELFHRAHSTILNALKKVDESK